MTGKKVCYSAAETIRQIVNLWRNSCGSEKLPREIIDLLKRHVGDDVGDHDWFDPDFCLCDLGARPNKERQG